MTAKDTLPTSEPDGEVPEGLEPLGNENFLGGAIPEEHDPPEVAEAKAAERLAAKQNADAALANLEQEKLLAQTTVTEGASAGTAAVAMLQAQIDALRGQLAAVQSQAADRIAEGEKGSPGGYPWMYWRLPATWGDPSRRNWVTYGQGGLSPAGHRDPGSYAMAIEAGMIPLNKYGIIEPPTDPRGWLSFIPIIQRGGAIEFPITQIIAFKWHVRPPLPGITFPQYEMAKQDVMPVTCEACGFRLYFLKTDNQAGNFYRGHLMQAHEYPFREAAEAVKRQGLSIVAFFAEDREFVEASQA